MAINFNKAEFVLSAVKASTFIRDGKPQVTFARTQQRGKILRHQPAAGAEEFRPRGRDAGQDQPDQLLRYRREDLFYRPPGYGYAKVSKEERDRWGRLMESYFAEPDLITLGVLIVDARHKPTADDVTMCDWFKGTAAPSSWWPTSWTS